jgi:hypothetical protein
MTVTTEYVNHELFTRAIMLPSEAANNAFSAHFTFLTISLRPLNQPARAVRHIRT